MGSIAEIEQTLAKLSPVSLSNWDSGSDAERNRKWDRQIEADSASGALDFLSKKVDENIAHGRPPPGA